MMENVVVAAHDLCIKQPKSADLFVSKHIAGAVYAWTYAYCSDKLFYAIEDIENTEACSPNSKRRICTFFVPSPVVNIFSLMSLDYCLCQNGSIYRIPTCSDSVLREPVETNISSEDVFMDVSLEVSHSVQTESLWKVIHIQDCHQIFADEKCKMVYPFGEFISTLLEDQTYWLIKVYKVSISKLGNYKLQQMLSIPLPCSIRMKSHPVMTAFKSGDDSNVDMLEAPLLSCIINKPVTSSCQWAILVTTGEGEVFSVPFDEGRSDEISVLPLFCLHQPVVKIIKILIDATRRQHGLVCVGSLGKVILLFKSSESVKSLSIVEVHIPGPVKCWSSLHGLAFHTDGVSLWKTLFERKDTGISAPNLVTSKMSFENVVAVHVCSNWNNRELSDVLFYTEDGRLLLLQNFDSTNMVLEVPNHHLSNFNSMSLKTLLNQIHECSEHFARVTNAQEDKKKLLRELACAAHLLFNEKVKKTFVISVTSDWTCSEPQNVSISVKLLNSGSFIVVGSHWHFVISVSTFSGRRLTKSVSIFGGLQPENSITVVMKVSLDDLVTDDNFPFNVACGLQFYMDVAHQNAESVCAETLPNSYSNQPPVTFCVNLCKTRVDELHFLRLDDSQPLPSCETAINDALLELARNRPAAGLHDIESIVQPISKVFKSSFTSFIKVNHNYIGNLLKGQTSSEDSTMSHKLLEYIIKPSEIPLNLCMKNGMAEFSLFGQKVMIRISENVLHAKIEIVVSCPYLMPKLRFAVLRRLQLLNGSTDGQTSKRKLSEGFPILQSSINKCLSLKSLLNQSFLLQPENGYYFINQIYKEMREHVSAELPFV